MLNKHRHPSRYRLAGLATGLFCASVLVGHRAVPATECVTFTADLVLVEVREDGVPLAAPAAYQDIRVGLWGRAPGEVQVIGESRDSATPFWKETYRASATSGR